VNWNSGTDPRFSGHADTVILKALNHLQPICKIVKLRSHTMKSWQAL